MSKFVYTDGACSNNGKVSSRSGYGVFFGDNDERNVSEAVPSNMKQTNNVGELLGILKAFDIMVSLNDFDFTIVTDSNYCILCATSYGSKQHAKGWTANIPNKELVKKLYTLYHLHHVPIMKVEAHTGKSDKHSYGNMMADRLANEAIGVYMINQNQDQNQKEQSKFDPIVYLRVPFAEKDQAKSLGAKWNPKKKQWYCYESSVNLFQKWLGK